VEERLSEDRETERQRELSDAAASCENLVWVFLSIWWFSFSRFLFHPFSLLTIKFANVVRCKQKFCSFWSEEIDEGGKKNIKRFGNDLDKAATTTTTTEALIYL
jgi:hypothetical protein